MHVQFFLRTNLCVNRRITLGKKLHTRKTSDPFLSYCDCSVYYFVNYQSILTRPPLHSPGESAYFFYIIFSNGTFFEGQVLEELVTARHFIRKTGVCSTDSNSRKLKPFYNPIRLIDQGLESYTILIFYKLVIFSLLV